jgi:Tfp pilus assembly protein PilO
MKAVIELARKNRKVQALVILLVAVVAVDIGFYVLRTSPAGSRADQLSGRIGELRESFRKKEAEYRYYHSFDTGRADLEKFKDLLPLRSDYIKVVRAVNALAKEDGMKSTSFGTERKEFEKQGDVVQLNFSMPVSGSYKNVRKFIYDVETSSLFLNIDSLALSADAESGAVSLRIGISTYVRL